VTWIAHLVDWGKCITHGSYYLYKKPWSKGQCVSSHENLEFQAYVFVSSSNLFSSFLRCVLLFVKSCYCSRTPLIRNNCDGEPSGYAEIPDNWISFFKEATLAVCSSAVTIYSMYLCMNLSTTPCFAVLEAITLYCTWSDNRWFQGNLVFVEFSTNFLEGKSRSGSLAIRITSVRISGVLL